MIIGLTGLAGSGKNTVAEMLGGHQMAFAAPLKAFCGEVFGFTERQLYGPSEAREEPSATFTRPDGTPLTARFALQTLGTEWGRSCDPDVWVKAGLRKARDLENFAKHGHTALVVVTDVRFVNEAVAIRDAGGQVWRIKRGDGWRSSPSNHPSEREVHSPAMTAFVTHEIPNHEGLDQLRQVVNAALLESGI